MDKYKNWSSWWVCESWHIFSLKWIHFTLKWIHFSLKWIHFSLKWIHFSPNWIHFSLKWMHLSLKWIHFSLNWSPREQIKHRIGKIWFEAQLHPTTCMVTYHDKRSKGNYAKLVQWKMNAFQTKLSTNCPPSTQRARFWFFVQL